MREAMADRRARARTDGAAPRRFRGAGRGRTSRRALARGGTGPARRLNDTVATWPDVRITPTFGRWGYFVRGQLFGCFPVRPQERDLWVRLPLDQQALALRQEGVRPHRRFSRRGWIEMDVETARDIERAVRWLRRAHAGVIARPSAAPDDEADDLA